MDINKFTPIYPISDEETVKRAKLSVEIAIMELKALGVPVVEYDPKTKKVYKVYNDGTKIELQREKIIVWLKKYAKETWIVSKF